MLRSQFEKIIRGEINYQSNSLGLNLLIARLTKNYKMKPVYASPCGLDYRV